MVKHQRHERSTRFQPLSNETQVTTGSYSSHIAEQGTSGKYEQNTSAPTVSQDVTELLGKNTGQMNLIRNISSNNTVRNYTTIVPLTQILESVLIPMSNDSNMFTPNTPCLVNAVDNDLEKYLPPSLMACPLVIACVIIFKLYKRILYYKFRQIINTKPIYMNRAFSVDETEV